PATPSQPEEWQTHPTSATVPTARWPKLPNFIYADADMLSVPAATNFDLPSGLISLTLDAGSPKRGTAPSAKATPWPQPETQQVMLAAASLPAPAGSVFDIPEKARAWLQPFPVQMHHYAEDELPPGVKVASASEPRGRHKHGRLGARQSRRM